MRPLGALPALWATTSRPSLRAQWPSMPSASTLRAELWVHRTRTWAVIGNLREAQPSVREAQVGKGVARGGTASQPAPWQQWAVRYASSAFMRASDGR